MKARNPDAMWVDHDFIQARFPPLKDNYTHAAIYDPNVYDLDVNALQEGYLKSIRRSGSTFEAGFQVNAIERTNGLWLVSDGKREYAAPCLAGWSIVLYAVYAVFLIWGFKKFGGDILSHFSLRESDSDWFVGGVKYATYNIAVVPTILFCISHIETRKEAFTAGILGGLLAMLPAVLFYLVMVGFYPEILSSAVPVNDILAAMQIPVLLITFNIVIFGTFIETGTALLHAVNERIARVYSVNNKKLPTYLRPAVALVIMTLAIFVGDKIGLIDLIRHGYGFLTYVFLAVFILPLLTIGSYKIFRNK